MGCSDHALVKFTVLKDKSQEKIEVKTLNFKKANFKLFKDFASDAPRKLPLETRQVERSWQIFEDAFHGAPELLFPMSKKSGKG